MKRITLFIVLIISTTLHAQRERAEAYINKYKDLAIAEMQRTGIPASITLAQGILESQFGESDLAVNANNHFGIKCKTEWTGQKTYHDDDLKKECFRVYPSAEDSYKDHSNFLMTRDWYAFLFKLEPTDDAGWAYGLKKAGYATEKDYPQRLLKLINDYQLQQYSLAALGKPFTEITTSNKRNTSNTKKQRIINQSDALINTPVPVADATPIIVKKSIEATEPEENNEQELTVKKTENTGATTKKNVSYPNTVFTINHSRVIYAEAGVSLLSIANNYDISLSRLIEFNELSETDILINDQLIFLEKKLKKGATDFHFSTANETLAIISQKEGVRLESLLEYNKIKKDALLREGDKINLRAPNATPNNNTIVKQPK
ncbi:MAG: glucosaminidase domain-containing protein [Bacteroidota bacterium]